MSVPKRIIIGGDAPLVLFQLPPNQAKIEIAASYPGKGVSVFDKAAIFPLRVGAAHTNATVRAILSKNRNATPEYPYVEHPAISEVLWHPKTKESWDQEIQPCKLFRLKAQEPLKNGMPCLRIEDEEQLVEAYRPKDSEFHVRATDGTTLGASVSNDDILVSWLSYPKPTKEVEFRESVQPKCDFHIQIGGLHRVPPQTIAKPSRGRFVVTSLFEASQAHRIRKGLSYETMAIDFLRAFRGAKSEPAWEKEEPMFPLLHGKVSRDYKTEESNPCFPCDLLKSEPLGKCFLVVRFSNSAAMIYWMDGIPSKTKDSCQYVDRAVFFFHKDRPAPIDTPNLGRVQGYTGFLGAHLAVAAADPRNTAIPADDEIKESWIGNAVKDSLLWQAKMFEQGFFRLFFKAEPVPGEIGKWQSQTISTSSWDDKTRAHFFEDFRGITKEDRKDILSVEVDIPEAVSYRKHWFMAKDLIGAKDESDPRSVLKKAKEDWINRKKEKGTFNPSEKFRPSEDDLTACFRRRGIVWLSTEDAKPEKDVPVAKIGDLALADRAEIEDYLAIQTALSQYCDGTQPKPLNIGVFGAPGSGKSFGVVEITKHLRKKAENLAKEPITFNLSQFTTLDHLMTAFHQIRNECLSGKIPLVFFDEFDSAFEGRPFGWFKYFLAPMQDASFIQDGITHRLGRAIFIFAGGVNRTFDELNSRARNTSFVEAKGPDFISRLRGHLNIRGINKPDDEHDQGRYLLRRAVLLHGMAVRLLEHKGNKLRPKQGLMAENVARAFLTVARFKHGARSMEALLGMCDSAPGRTLTASDLPTKKQLDMHVDAGEFLAALQNEK